MRTLVASATFFISANSAGASELASMEGNYQQMIVLRGEQGDCNPNNYTGEIDGRTGKVITTFCWHLDLNAGKVMISAGYDGAIETFDWTPDGWAFLRFSTRI